jgi:hypothetical protein
VIGFRSLFGILKGRKLTFTTRPTVRALFGGDGRSASIEYCTDQLAFLLTMHLVRGIDIHEA